MSVLEPTVSTVAILELSKTVSLSSVLEPTFCSIAMLSVLGSVMEEMVELSKESVRLSVLEATLSSVAVLVLACVSFLSVAGQVQFLFYNGLKHFPPCTCDNANTVQIESRYNDFQCNGFVFSLITKIPSLENSL